MCKKSCQTPTKRLFNFLGCACVVMLCSCSPKNPDIPAKPDVLDNPDVTNNPPPKSPSIQLGKPGGIANVGGASCFTNAALQILAAFYPNRIDPEKQGLQEKHRQLANAIKNVVEAVNQGNKVDAEQAKDFFHRLASVINTTARKESDYIKLGRQEDAHVVLQELFNVLQFPYAEKKELFIHPSTGEVRAKHSVDLWNLLPLTIMGSQEVESIDMQQLLDRNFEREEIEVKWKESDTNNTPGVGKQLVLDSLSKLANGVLPIYLLRHSWNETAGAGKIETKADNVWSLTLKKEYLSNSNTDLPYNLVGFIIQDGSARGGHYTAWLKRGDVWYHASDSTVTEQSEQSAKEASEDGYIYFYQPSH